MGRRPYDTCRKKAQRKGDLYFAPDVPCPKCGTSWRLTATSRCCQCAKIDYASRRISLLNQKREDRLNNLDLYRARDKDHRERNREKRIAYCKDWHARNPGKNSDPEKSRAWYAANKEKAKATRLAWVAANPEKYKAIQRVSQQARRARQRFAVGVYTVHDIANLMARQKSKCPMCRCSIKTNYEIDHIMPLKLGGTNELTNLQLLCKPCNRSKGAKHPITFAQSRGLLL